uniref:DUF6598 domain-containing protein n=1 Tax=Leersia perrieri TaxID=77586 RepID=A0A0D9XKS8_9ORYZ
MGEDKVEAAGTETRDEEEDAEMKRGRELGLMEGGASRKKREPEAEWPPGLPSLEWCQKVKENYEKRVAENPDEDWFDPVVKEARDYRKWWEYMSCSMFGPFDKITDIPAMRYTDDPDVPSDASEKDTLQIFSVKITETKQDFQWPIHVFGMSAVRDTIDHHRNIIFNRTRDDCQILTKENPYLLLTGPSRVVAVCDFVDFEAVLKVKGSVESEDKDLSLIGGRLTQYKSNLSTVELTYGYFVESVEATISVQVIDGSWSDGFSAQFTAHTSSLKHNKILLLDSGYDNLAVNADGIIELSRRVVSVELEGELKVSVVANGDNSRVQAEIGFIPDDDDRSSAELNVGFCKMEVTAACGGLLLDVGDGKRCVVSAEFEGELGNSVVAFGCDRIWEIVHTYEGRYCVDLDVGFCKMEITVAGHSLPCIDPDLRVRLYRTYSGLHIRLA